jgi:hypothetical protein
MERQFEDLTTVTLERVVAGLPRTRNSARQATAPNAYGDAARAIRVGFRFGFLAGFIVGISPPVPSGSEFVPGVDAIVRSLLGFV